MWFQVGGAAITALILLAAFYRQVVRPMWDTFKRMDARLEYVDQEMRNNGGGSMRDAIDRIDGRTGDHEIRLVRLETFVPSAGD